MQHGLDTDKCPCFLEHKDPRILGSVELDVWNREMNPQPMDTGVERVGRPKMQHLLICTRHSSGIHECLFFCAFVN